MAGVDQSYQIKSLTVGMVGTNGRPGMKTKAAETGTLVRWACVFCGPGQPGNRLRLGDLLHAAGECLVEYANILKTSSFNIEWDSCNRLLFLLIRHYTLMEETGQEQMPKAHLMAHLTTRIPEQGNPRYYSTFTDETLNLTLAGMASSSHRTTWEEGVFRRVRLLPQVSKVSPFAVFS